MENVAREGQNSGHLLPYVSSVSSRNRTTSESQNTENDLTDYFSILPRIIYNMAKRDIS